MLSLQYNYNKFMKMKKTGWDNVKDCSTTTRKQREIANSRRSSYNNIIKNVQLTILKTRKNQWPQFMTWYRHMRHVFWLNYFIVYPTFLKQVLKFKTIQKTIQLSTNYEIKQNVTWLESTWIIINILTKIHAKKKLPL